MLKKNTDIDVFRLLKTKIQYWTEMCSSKKNEKNPAHTVENYHDQNVEIKKQKKQKYNEQ